MTIKKESVRFLKNKKIAIMGSFLFAFILMAWMIDPLPDMLLGGGDVTDIWKTITSFYSGNIQPSYVLYKGFLSVYPYVWFYKLSSVLSMSPWFFMKLYHCILFAYVSAIGFPFIISKLLKIEIKFWRRILVIIAFFIFWKSNNALQQIMIDLPALTFFVLSVSAALKIGEKKLKTPKLYFIYTGIVMGLASTFTGQYMPALIIIFIYIIINMFRKRGVEKKHAALLSLLAISLIIIGVSVPRAYNQHFEKTIVNELRSEGAWIPSASDWSKLGIRRLKRNYTLFSVATIPSNRTLAIIKDDKKEGYEEFFNSYDGYTNAEIKQLILKHPVDFITTWCNGLLLSVSLNNNQNSVVYLFLSYSLLFISLYIIFKRIRITKDLFSTNTLIVIAFLCCSLVTCLMHLEMRYVMAFQGLYIAAAILEGTMWNTVKSIGGLVKECIEKRSIKLFFSTIKNSKFPWTFVIYLVFVIMCFMNYAALLENCGPDPASILFKY